WYHLVRPTRSCNQPTSPTCTRFHLRDGRNCIAMVVSHIPLGKSFHDVRFATAVLGGPLANHRGSDWLSHASRNPSTPALPCPSGREDGHPFDHSARRNRCPCGPWAGASNRRASTIGPCDSARPLCIFHVKDPARLIVAIL